MEPTTGRGRTNSIFQKLGLVETEEDDESPLPGVQMYSNIVEKSPRRPTISHTLPKLPPVTKLAPVVVAVLKGCEADVTTLLVLLRFSENRSTTVYLLLPKDYEAFSETVLNAVHAFKRRISGLTHVQVVPVDIISTDTEGLAQVVEEYKLDFFVGAFVEPTSAHMLEPHTVESSSSTPHDILSHISSLAVRTRKLTSSTRQCRYPVASAAPRCPIPSWACWAVSC
jgi:hypothetical protein